MNAFMFAFTFNFMNFQLTTWLQLKKFAQNG